MGEDLSDIVAARAKHREYCIAKGALQQRSDEASVGFHMADFGLDGTSALEQICQQRGDAPPGAADQHAGGFHPVPSITAIDDRKVRGDVGQDADLLQRFTQCMAVIGVSRESAGTDDKAAVDGGGQADLGAELIGDTRLAFGDTVDLGLVQGVNLALVPRPLFQQAANQPERFQHLVAQ